MKRKVLLFLILALLAFGQTKAQYPYGDKWYQNPLGFKPLNLHTSMGFIVPAVATGVCLLLTEKNPNLKEKLSIYSELSPSWGYKYPYTFIPQVNTGLNYQLRKFLSIGVEFGILFPTDNFNQTVGIDIKPFARFYPVNNEKWKIYFESGGGFVYLINEFPQPTDRDNRLGLKLNGITKYCIGAEFNVSQKTAILLGVRHLHISNGDSKGVERNPSHDSNGFFIGLNYKIATHKPIK